MKWRMSPPAKINLGLRVLGRRDDGYHDLDTEFCAVSLHDELVYRPGNSFRVRVKGVQIPGPDLVERAARLWFSSLGRELRGSFELRKRIPLGSGLGGGSSDAAAALRLLNSDPRPGLSAKRLARLAGSLGADLPFFLIGGRARGRGKGDRLSPLRPYSRPRWFVLALDPRPLSTPEVFRIHDSLPGRRYNARVARGFRNDLRPAAETLRPGLRRKALRLEALWGRPVSLSGSGPTLFAEFASEKEAVRARLRAQRRGFRNLKAVRSLSRSESLRIWKERS